MYLPIHCLNRSLPNLLREHYMLTFLAVHGQRPSADFAEMSLPLPGHGDPFTILHSFYAEVVYPA
jgi:hypothetical protein